MTRIIPLTHGYFTFVDDEDYDDLAQFKWHLDSTGYARRNVWLSMQYRNSGEHMHRRIMGNPGGKQIDHINTNKLDNRRTNLRVCERQVQNIYNTPKRAGYSSQYKGVSWSPKKSKWVAQISKAEDDSRSKFLGHFQDEYLAALAYDRAARERYGEYAWLNFPKIADYSEVPKQGPQASSGYYGVSYYKAYAKWAASFVINDEVKFVGYFDTAESAAKARETAARRTVGFKGRLNFDEDPDYVAAKRANTSVYRGVSRAANRSKWTAHFRKRLGSFNSEVEAARAYDKAAYAVRGDKAKLNFPGEVRNQ